jgi:hypothetical protein
MRLALIARHDHGEIFTRFVHPDFIICDVLCPTISLYNLMRHKDGGYMKLVAADLIESMPNTSLALIHTCGRSFAMFDVNTQIMIECYRKCRGVGSKWTIVTGDDVDSLLHIMCETISDNMFFI